MSEPLPCECEAPGFCPRRGRCVPAFLWRCCQGEVDGSASYLRLLDGKPPEPPPATLDCVHRGAPTGEVRECQSCRGATRIKLFACSLHGTCTVKKNVGVAVCRECADRTS